MDRKDRGRTEPTLADLEAFERLMRDSLQASHAQTAPVQVDTMQVDTMQVDPAHVAPGTAEPHAAPFRNQPSQNHPPSDHALPQDADQAAMAELARLINLPVDFGTPHGTPPVHPPHTVDASTSGGSLRAERHLHGSASATLASDWNSPPEIGATFSVAEAAPYPQAPAAQPDPHALSLDPLAAFEEELRRFDAIRMAEQNPTHELRSEYPAQATPGSGVDPVHETSGYAAPHAQPVDDRWYAQPHQSPAQESEAQAVSSLDAAEERLAAEAAVGAAAAGYAAHSHRSKGIFLALGGIAVAGLAVIGGNFVFGSGNKGGAPGSVPVITAKTEPAKQKPDNPGGLEIPNQNKQVLAARNAQETKPAQVVNSTEQPLDLNQVTRRDSVRVIAPSPFQGAPTNDSAANSPPAPVPRTEVTRAEANSAPAGAPLRVTSVRIPVGASDSAPANAAAPGVPGVSAPAGATVRASTPAPLPRISANAPTPPAKVESRPVTAQPRPETPKAEPPPRVTSAPVAPPAKVAPVRSANAPLSLTPAKVATPKTSPPKVAAPKAAAPKTSAPKVAAPAATASAGSGYAIQLASRPTEADARSASVQLKGKYASALGARSPVVMSGEANGKTVYRVRVAGYSQAQAVEACKKVKAAGGGCFVTKQ